LRKLSPGWKAKGAAGINIYKQVKVAVPADVAVAFKKACALGNVSMASKLALFMADFSGSKLHLKGGPQPDYATRRKRRAAISAILKQLELIKSFEEQYMENMPENLQRSSSYEKADEAVSGLDEAIELLASVY
jgi:hypothetical protein